MSGRRRDRINNTIAIEGAKWLRSKGVKGKFTYKQILAVGAVVVIGGWLVSIAN